MQNASQRKPCNAPFNAPFNASFNASFNAPFNTPFNTSFNIPFNAPSTPQQRHNTPAKTKHPSKDNNNLDLDILKKDKHQ